jgi:hypothetical protein
MLIDGVCELNVITAFRAWLLVAKTKSLIFNQTFSYNPRATEFSSEPVSHMHGVRLCCCTPVPPARIFPAFRMSWLVPPRLAVTRGKFRGGLKEIPAISGAAYSRKHLHGRVSHEPKMPLLPELETFFCFVL